jgi:hypothetical membrane protein
MLRTVSLLCGAASTLLYFGMDIIASLLYPGYSYRDQAISELSAIGAPTRSLWIPLGYVYALLIIVFGFGVWISAGQKRALRVVAGMMTAIGVLGFVAWPFAAMHQREVLAAGGATFSDSLHVVLGMADTLLFLLSIAFGATVLGRRFRLYSIASILVVLVFGALNAMDAPRLGANEPTPWMGIWERISIYGAMIWIAVLGVALLRRHEGRSDVGQAQPESGVAHRGWLRPFHQR